METIDIKRIGLKGLVIFGIWFMVSCEKDPVTLVLHDPIYPSATDPVTFSLEKVSAGTIDSAELFETVSTINSSGTVTAAGSEVSIRTWSSPSGDLSHTRTGGYGTNKLVTYRWRVATPEQNKSFTVTFATRPYPVSDMPAPVYAQGDPDDVMDLVFIPDNDVADLADFRENCRGAIRESFFDEPRTQIWRKQYNFYINPDRGTATDYDRISTDGLHQTPDNYANLGFAEGKVLMHQNDLRDYASGGLFSTEMQNRGTILHESGHSLYDLKDEYAGGVHVQLAELPNNWSTLAGAEAAGDDYGDCKSAADAVEMGSSGWFKLCVNNCQMKTTGLTHTEYDCPCIYRINFAVLDNAIN